MLHDLLKTQVLSSPPAAEFKSSQLGRLLLKRNSRFRDPKCHLKHQDAQVETIRRNDRIGEERLI